MASNSLPARFILLLCVITLAEPPPLTAQTVPSVRVETDAVIVQPGDAFDVRVELGSASTPVPNFYGAGVQVGVDADRIRLTGVGPGALVRDAVDSGSALAFPRIVMPDEDLNGDGEPDEQHYAAFSAVVTRPNPAISDGNGTFVEADATVPTTAPTGPASLALNAVEVTDPSGLPVEVAAQGTVVSVSTTRRAFRMRLAPGDPAPRTFSLLDGLIADPDFVASSAELVVTRAAEPLPGPDLPPAGSDVYVPAAPGFWAIDASSNDIKTKVCIPFSLVDDAVDPVTDLRVLLRSSTWAALPTSLEPSTTQATRVCATITGSGEFALGVPTRSIPVELATFTGTWSGDAVELQWSTASETNNAGFEIERSVGGTGFIDVGWVDGFGTTAQPRRYRFTDSRLPFTAKQATYRLRQTDTDGTVSHSPPLVVRRTALTDRLLPPFPHPVREATTIRFELAQPGPVRLALYNVLGQRVRTIRNSWHPAGPVEIRMQANGLSSGTYFITLTSASSTSSHKVVIAR